MFGMALSRMGRHAKPVVDMLEAFSTGMFIVLSMVMRIAPIAAFGAIAFTVGKYGLGSLVSLGQLMGSMYLTCVAFVFIVLGAVARVSGFSLWKFLRYIREEIFTVLGTSSSESVVPQLMKKMEHLGVSKPVVGLVVPAGVTFNPDGQCIYYTMAAIFIAQATNTPLTMVDQFVILGVLMVTSKGSAGVTGSGFITLAATLASMGKIPVAGMVLLLGVDRFMSEARAITNTIGNAVGTVVVARWVGAVDRVRMQRILDGEELEQPVVAAPQPADERDEVAVGLVQHRNASA
jgi:aerobic C4-dicarboxylate transport protein